MSNETKTCVKCQKTFSSNRYLQQHLNSDSCQKSHICEKCNKSFSSAANLRTHLRRKNPCIPNKVPVINTSSDENKCMYCGKCYSSTYNLKRHMNGCPMKNNQSAMFKMIETLVSDVKELKEENKILRQQNLSTQQINNVTINNNNIQNNLYLNVTICSFGNEDLTKLDTQKVLNLLKNHVKDFMPKMIEHIHANPDYPEFHNVFYDPKQEKALVFAPISETEMSWQTRDFNEISRNITNRIKNHIHPTVGSYYNQANDNETRNNISKILYNEKWETPEILEENKISLSKLMESDEFKKMVNMNP